MAVIKEKRDSDEVLYAIKSCGIVKWSPGGGGNDTQYLPLEFSRSLPFFLPEIFSGGNLLLCRFLLLC